MAHFHLDYSANLESRLDMAGLCRVIRDAALATGEFALAGIRVRACAASHWVIADGDERHAYLDLSVRLRGGRSLEARRAATAAIFAALEGYCADLLATSSLMLSMEMRDIDPELGPKTSSIRRYLPGDLQ